MKPIPKPLVTDTWIQSEFGIEVDYCSLAELRLLLDVLAGVNAEKRAMQGDEKEVRAAQRMIDAAYMAIYRNAPHLIDAARKAQL